MTVQTPMPGIWIILEKIITGGGGGGVHVQYYLTEMYIDTDTTHTVHHSRLG